MTRDSVDQRALMADEETGQPTEKPQPAGRSVHPIVHITSWIFFSNLTILFNKWLIDNRGFRYPVILTCWHLIFATVATQILAKTTHLLDGRKNVKMTGKLYLRAIVPIGLLYSASLVCSNMVYLYLSVAFIQMLKSAAPVAVLLTSWAWRVEDPSLKRLLNVLLIVGGVALASFGEIDFSLTGFLFQIGGIIFEAVRLVMIQVLLSEDGQKMDPLVSLYYYAPVCALMNILIAIPSEANSFDFADLAKCGYWLLLLNAIVAFMLNVSSVFLIGKTSSLVMTLTGILKNILLVVASVMIWHTSITPLQFCGYAVALGGLVYYSVGWEQITGVSSAIWLWIRSLWEAPTRADESRLPPAFRRALFMTLGTLTVVILVAGALYGTGTGANAVAAVQASLSGAAGGTPTS
ncbi:triose-phosphate transporter family-domain-containing protein [Lasiosphaeria miniovina]|uniref:Triose-phosphate transporter family-domain-containing protein n=1 Tax=Lasiosphaeria miniovina TaxID=1954250 RepID=A0AA40B6M2_9PEZI|nr:triose-phosphate transporter family-domain-containing protein [Lasiosphaeria miniovina]KAK0728273.1 triose-phosphate transporter family-domain-containing protein [Lasiosphaeria miniovina]